MSNIIHLGQVRKLWFSEKNLFRDHLLRLDAESRRLRFERTVSDEFIHDYVDKIDERRYIIHGFFKEGKICGAAELVKTGENWQPVAEAAFSVDRIYQNSGVGSELMGRVIRSARNRNVRQLVIRCLASNAKMQHIASKFKAHLHFTSGEVVAELVPSDPTYFSYLEEAVDDGNGFLMATLDLQHRYMTAA